MGRAMKLGITGGPGEGKSTVLSYLKEAGFATASADDFAREVFDDPSVQVQIAEALALRLPLDRHAVREAMLDEADKRIALNKVMHPLIRQKIRESDAVAIEVPLLVETCLQGEFDRIWVVTCGIEEQLRRLTERLGVRSEAERLVAAQLPTTTKCAFADRIIRTNGPSDTVRSLVIEAFAQDLAEQVA